ncbi:ribonuclease III [bacterium]|nr:ribonuclease III [bacterium]
MSIIQQEQVLARIIQMIKAKPATKKQLQVACMHRSWINETSDPSVEKYHDANERLEFLGDSVLGLIIATELYHRLPKQDEGRLSKAKARLVSATALAHYARELDLGAAILLGHGEESSGGRRRVSLLANVLEAIIGALFLTEGYKKTEAFILKLWQQEIAAEVEGSTTEDYKSLLQEYWQKEKGILPDYTVEKTTGPDHCRNYEISVAIAGRICGHGTGSSKKQAEQMAAGQAYKTLNQK